VTTADTANGRDPGRVQSVDRAVTILEFLARNGWSGVTEVGEALDVHKSTAFRLLTTLESRGLVEQHADTGQYHLGFGLVHLARAVVVGPDIAGRARAGCEWLAGHTAETITLSVLEGDECVTIDQIIPTSAVVSRSWLGRRTPSHCTSPGKVFLAHLDADRRAGILGEPLKRYTDHTITDAAELEALLDQVLADGYATTIEELEDGLSSVAAPVLSADGRVVATIEVSGPSYRLGPAELAEVVPLVTEAAERASVRFGYSNHD
jgi:DNA-binding IclR family transcriptional regulator